MFYNALLSNIDNQIQLYACFVGLCFVYEMGELGAPKIWWFGMGGVNVALRYSSCVLYWNELSTLTTMTKRDHPNGGSGSVMARCSACILSVAFRIGALYGPSCHHSWSWSRYWYYSDGQNILGMTVYNVKYSRPPAWLCTACCWVVSSA